LCWHKIAGGCCARQHKCVLATSKNHFWTSASVWACWQSSIQTRTATWREVHPIFHVSQLKAFAPDYSPVYDRLPKFLYLEKYKVEPKQILERGLVNTSRERPFGTPL
jgi:hypothetical protein